MLRNTKSVKQKMSRNDLEITEHHSRRNYNKLKTHKEQNSRQQKHQQPADSENNPIHKTRLEINKNCSKPAPQETNKTIQLQESPTAKRTLPSN